MVAGGGKLVLGSRLSTPAQTSDSDRLFSNDTLDQFLRYTGDEEYIQLMIYFGMDFLGTLQN